MLLGDTAVVTKLFVQGMPSCKFAISTLIAPSPWGPGAPCCPSCPSEVKIIVCLSNTVPPVFCNYTVKNPPPAPILKRVGFELAIV